MKKRILMVVLASCLQAMMASAQTTGRIVGTVSTADEGVIETVSNPGGAVVIIDNLTKQESIVIASVTILL